MYKLLNTSVFCTIHGLLLKEPVLAPRSAAILLVSCHTGNKLTALQVTVSQQRQDVSYDDNLYGAVLGNMNQGCPIHVKKKFLLILVYGQKVNLWTSRRIV